MIFIERLLAAAKSVQSLSEFIENGGVADVVAEISIAAAGSTLSKAKFANDARAQVLLTVGHLETALSAVAKQIATPVGLEGANVRTMSRATRLSHEYRGICCLLSVCYKYLGEDELCSRQLEQAVEPPRQDEYTVLGIASRLTLLATAIPQMVALRLFGLATGDDTLLDEMENEGPNITVDNVRALRSALLGEKAGFVAQ